VCALASPAFSRDLDAPLDVVRADLGDGSALRLTRAPGAGRRPVFLVCEQGAQGAQGPAPSRFAAECAAAGFAALEVHGAPWSPGGIDRALNWLERGPRELIDSSRTFAGAEGEGAHQALVLADRARGIGQRAIAGVVVLNGDYGPDAVDIARRVARDHDSGARGASILLLGHFDRAEGTLDLAKALMQAGTPFQLQILADDAAVQASRPRRALTLARGFVDDGSAAPIRA
jgi:hypothetical protein